MSEVVLGHWQLSDPALRQLIRRCELAPVLLRRAIEEEIMALVQPDLQPDPDTWAAFYQAQQLESGDAPALEAWLQRRGWQEQDLRLHLLRGPALQRFMEQRYGPGLEEHFLTRKHELDSAIYSLLRVRDAGLARELWIQLSEQEVTFAELASRHSDGPEAQTKGIIGPVRLGSIDPGLAERLRSLRAGELRPPEALGGWHVLLRLEQLSPARFDAATRNLLLQEQFDRWIQQRVDAILAGDTPESLHFDPDA